MAGQQIPHS